MTNGVTLVGADKGLVRLELTNAPFSCGGDLSITGASLRVHNGAMTCDGKATVRDGALQLNTGAAAYEHRIAADLVISGSSRVEVQGGAVADVTNGVPGATVAVGGSWLLGDGCWVYPSANPTNGGAPLFTVGGHLVVGGTNAGFNANFAGYKGAYRTLTPAYGPGAGTGFAGGSYGGRGGNTGAADPYGSAEAPTDGGSGGESNRGNADYAGNGGGLIRIAVAGHAELNGGSFLADGGAGGQWAAGGSGGGIFLTCRRFLGGGAIFKANGGNGYYSATYPLLSGGGGGGGRIAVHYRSGDQDAVCSVGGGLSGVGDGDEGSVRWRVLPAPATVLLLR